MNVEEDAKDISRMVLAAKNGNWTDVFIILDRKPRIINCIPEDRAWGALHQAAWYEDGERVTKLLSYRTCDSEIKTKQDRSNESGMIASLTFWTVFKGNKGNSGLVALYRLT